MAKVRYLKVSEGEKVYNISQYPSFCANGDVRGMKKNYYGEDALLVRCGSYIYNVTTKPEIYYAAK